MTSHELNESDLDIQDRMGYVDTGPSQRSNGNNNNFHKVATSTSAHLIIKEPKPQRQVNIPTEKKRAAFKPELSQPRRSNSIDLLSVPTSQNGPSQHNGTLSHSGVSQHNGTPQHNGLPHHNQASQHNGPPQKNGLPQHNGPPQHNVPLNHNVSPSHNVTHSVPSLNLPSTPNYYNDRLPPRKTYQQDMEPPGRPNREEIKEMMVSKLYELADMLKSLNIEDDQQTRPRPTPSKSDPSQHDRRYTRGNNMSHSPVESQRKSPYQRDYYPYYDGPVYDYPQDDYYYAPPPPVPPPQRQGYRPRRKSYGNLREEETHHRLLARKNSRLNLRPRGYETRYDAYQDVPQPQPTSRYYYQPRHYSPDNYY